MNYEYIKEEKDIKEKSEGEKKLEFIMSFINTRDALENAIKNYEFADDSLIDYYLYEIKANQSKLNHLISEAKQQGIELDFASSLILRNKRAI